MAAVATLSYEEALNVIELWKTQPPSEEEQITFADAAMKLLSDEEQVRKFIENVKVVGTVSIEINNSFNHVDREFGDMVQQYGRDFPELAGFHSNWRSYKTRWVNHLWLSHDVANDAISVLRRFDNIYLVMVQNIKTDQDRLNVIKELQQFTDEKHDRSIEMSNGFQELERDIEYFQTRFGRFLADKKIDLDREATRLVDEINGLRRQISSLDGKIRDAETALAVSGGLLNLIGLIVSGSVLSSLRSERQGKYNQLRYKQNQLADVNRRQRALPHLKTDFDDVKPNIELICEKLILFGEIWSSVRSQSVQFRKHLEGGMGAIGNLRFRKEVELARDVCAPLERGLAQYVDVIEHSGIVKP